MEGIERGGWTHAELVELALDDRAATRALSHFMDLLAKRVGRLRTVEDGAKLNGISKGTFNRYLVVLSERSGSRKWPLSIALGRQISPELRAGNLYFSMDESQATAWMRARETAKPKRAA
jgi:hypothetical protein